jgi:glyoxylase-like metal-dependent hydrolase (beta-lactamase superfamily II)
MQRVGMGVLGIIKRMAPHFEHELDGAAERLPDATFDGDALSLEIGGRPVRLLHLGTGHTRGDVLVHLPEQRLLFAGDVAFFYVTPLAFEGHIGNWIEVCRRVLAMDRVDTIVPGHGPVGAKDDLRAMLAYLERIRAAARRAFDAGASQEDALRSIDLGEYAEWGDSERISFNVARLYQEFRGELDDVL